MICNPLSCYGVGKLMSENYLKIYKNKISFISLRMFNVYGPGQDMNNLRQGMVSIFLAQAKKNKKILVKGSLNRIRDFIYVDDVVNIWFKLFKSKIKNEIINLGTGKPTKVKLLINEIKKLIPGTIVKIRGTTPGDQNFVCSDNSKLKQKLKISKFKNIIEGIRVFKNSTY